MNMQVGVFQKGKKLMESGWQISEYSTLAGPYHVVRV
jgi:hypothetical protein